MAITITRYSDENIILDDDDREFREIRPVVDSTKRDDDLSHTVIGRQTYRDIADINYNDARLYFLICDYNKVVNPWIDPVAGTVLRIPSNRKVIEGF